MVFYGTEFPPARPPRPYPRRGRQLPPPRAGSGGGAGYRVRAGAGAATGAGGSIAQSEVGAGSVEKKTNNSIQRLLALIRIAGKNKFFVALSKRGELFSRGSK